MPTDAPATGTHRVAFGPVADFVEAAAGVGASPTALSGTLAPALTASYLRKSLVSRGTERWTSGKRKRWQVLRTRISSAKLLSSPSSALTASKSNTNCAKQTLSAAQGQMHVSWRGRVRVLPHLRECGCSSLVWCFQRGEHPHCARHTRWSAGRPRRVGAEATHIPCSSRPRQPAPQPKSPVSPLSAEVTSSCRSPAAPGCAYWSAAQAAAFYSL